MVSEKEKRKIKVLSRKFASGALRLAIALGIATAICQINLDYLEFFTYDIRYQLKPASPTSGKVVTIAIDHETLSQLGRDLTVEDQQQVLLKVLSQKPFAVVYTLDQKQFVGTNKQLKDFATTATQNPVYFAVNDLYFPGSESDFALKPPFESIEVLPAPQTVDKKIFAKDGVTRRMIISYQGNLTIHPLFASHYNNEIANKDYQGAFDFLDSKQALIDFRSTGTYKPLSFYNLLENKISLPDLSDKIVLIGRDTLISTADYVRTPFSREINAMTTLELHANMFDTMILNSAPILFPAWLDLILTGLVAVLTVFVVLRVRPLNGLALLVLTLCTLTVASYLTLWATDFVIGLAHPLVALFVCYYFFIPYRLIVENKKSWEYYHKNKLLVQVEELKSNFLRMMSHDLKTPLARIQGMTDLVAREDKNLSTEQRAAISSIAKSSEELTEFIGSILNLGRIESKEIKLVLKSRDINSLVSGVLEKCEYLARKKNIQFITELEPMFSIRIDEDLIKQVLTNLVENAIKYSPDNTKILVSTEEQNGRVIVQVADQGIGISKDEQSHIFTKFYRSQIVTSGPIKGSGLGLYLASYFVELHRGRIFVESEPQKGSTFTVELPMEVET